MKEWDLLVRVISGLVGYTNLQNEILGLECMLPLYQPR